MNALKALIIKDLQVNRKSLMVPIWCVLGFYVLFVGSTIYATVKGDVAMSINSIPLEFFSNVGLNQLMSFVLQAAMFFGFLGLIFGIAMLLTSSNLLNQDLKNKCELFHRSQPVSVWQITGSRFIAGIGGQLALAFIIGLVNMIISILAVAIFTPMHFNVWMGLNGFLLCWAHLSIALLVFGSILFLASAVFKDNAFPFTLGGLSILQLITYILNKIYGWNLPYILNAIYKLIMSGLLNVGKFLPSEHQFGITFSDKAQSAPDFTQTVLPPHFLYNVWCSLFTWDIVFKFVFCGVVFIAATYIYKQREVQF
jgi:hypothetical protein